jgi:hypothetical protein
MIKILDSSNINDLIKLLNNLNTVMGQDLNKEIPWTGMTRREILIDKLVNNWLRWESKTRSSIGWFENDQLRTVLFIDFSITIKAWSISYYFSDYKDYRSIHIGNLCAKIAMENAERIGYYEYYRVTEASKIKTFDRAWKNGIRKKYLMVVEEIIPAYEKPISIHAWEWLFEGNAKTIDCAIVKGILLPEYRIYENNNLDSGYK